MPATTTLVWQHQFFSVAQFLRVKGTLRFEGKYYLFFFDHRTIVTCFDSLHSGVAKGTSCNWPMFDPDGFRQVEELMIKFGLKVFSAYSSFSGK